MKRAKDIPIPFVPSPVFPYWFHDHYDATVMSEDDIGILWRAAHGDIRLDHMGRVFVKLNIEWFPFLTLKRMKRAKVLEQVAKILLCLYSKDCTLQMKLTMDPEFKLPPQPLPF